MKPIKPYVDYYVTQDNLYNCRRPGYDRDSQCRYVRLTGNSCNELNDYYMYNDSNFSTRYITTSKSIGNNAQVIMTNCSNIKTNNYNPGTENVLLTSFSYILAIGILLILFHFIYSFIKLIPRLWKSK